MASSSTAGPPQSPTQRRRNLAPAERFIRPCFEWQREGQCKYGSKCKYLHPMAINSPAELSEDGKSRKNPAWNSRHIVSSDNAEPAQASSSSLVAKNDTVPAQKSSTKTGVCFNWKAGRCSRGEQCRYRHEITPNSVQDPFRATKEQEDSTQKKEYGGEMAKDKICFDWKAGSCKRGDRCRYRHDIPQPLETSIQGVPATSEVSDSVTQNKTADSVKAGICFKWRRGKCTRGDLCQYRHEEVSSTAREPKGGMDNGGTAPFPMRQSENRAERRRLQQEARKERLAREKAERKAAAERIQRLAAERAERERALKQQQEEKERQEREEREAAHAKRKAHLEAQWKREAKVIEKHLVGGESTSSHGSLVTFAAGLEIQHVVTGFELCKITVKNLPDSATKKQIENIFTDQGVSADDFQFLEFIGGGGRGVPGRSDGRREALILVNSEHGEAIALGLEGIAFGAATLSFEVSENASWSGTDGKDGNAVSSPFLTINWNTPSHTLTAYYETSEIARRKSQELNGRVFGGSRLSAQFGNGYGATVKLSNCPAGAENDEAFKNMTGSYCLRPLARQLPYDHEETMRLLRAYLSRQSGAKMETFEIVRAAQLATAERKVKIQFNDWVDVKNAHASIDRKRLNIGNTGGYGAAGGFGGLGTGYSTPVMRPWYPKPLQYQIKIPYQQYDAQKRQWDGLAERKQGVNAFVATHRGDRGDIFVKVLGEDKKAAGALKVRVESLVAGEALDVAHWHPSFLSMRETSDLFRRIQGDTNAHIWCDHKNRLLRVYGEPNALQQVKSLVREEVARRESMETSTVIAAAHVGFFVREGLSRLKELIGEENARINLHSRPCRILTKGGDSARHHLQRLIDAAREVVALGAALPGLDEQQETCPICYDDVSNPEQLGCGHTYCSGCLKHFLEAAVESDSKGFPIKCMGAEATCNTPLSIPFLRRFLSEQTFKQLMDVAFNAYLEQHADEIKYCTTPDCKQIYRRETHKVTIQCPTCFATVCSRCCEEAHEGMTCDERRVLRNPQEQERLNDLLAQQSGFKRCPRCNIWIEKNEGCNHISCKCGTHICWRCMKTFVTGGEVYNHMNAEHGNFYDEAPAGVREIAGVNYNDPRFLAEQAGALAQAAAQRQAEAQRRERARMHEPLRRPYAVNAQPALAGLPIAAVHQRPVNAGPGLPVRQEEPPIVRRNWYQEILDAQREEDMRRQRQEDAERIRRNAALIRAQQQPQQENRGFLGGCTIM